MLFKGTPNMLVNDSKTNLPLFTFDENGLYETDNEKIIPRMKIRFEVVEKPGPVQESLQEPAQSNQIPVSPKPEQKPNPQKPNHNKSKSKR